MDCNFCNGYGLSIHTFRKVREREKAKAMMEKALCIILCFINALPQRCVVIAKEIRLNYN